MVSLYIHIKVFPCLLLLLWRLLIFLVMKWCKNFHFPSFLNWYFKTEGNCLEITVLILQSHFFSNYFCSGFCHHFRCSFMQFSSCTDKASNKVKRKWFFIIQKISRISLPVPAIRKLVRSDAAIVYKEKLTLAKGIPEYILLRFPKEE